ncbi:MAG: hypothetical protein ACI4SE_04990 [Lachnospiraceae bacterium]
MDSPLNFWRRANDVGTDSGVFKYIAFAMTQGEMPYRDSFDHKGPLLYLINYFASYIDFWYGIWVVEFAFMIVTICCLYKTFRLKCSRLISMCALLTVTAPLFAFFEGGNLAEEYAMTFIAMSLYIFLDYFLNNNVTIFRLILCGFSCGAVCMLRANMVAVWIVFCVAVIVRCIQEHDYRSLWKFIGFFSLGFAMMVVPILILLGCKGVLKDFIDCYLVFNMKYSSPTNTSGRGTILSQKIRVFLMFLNQSVVLLAFLILIYMAYKKKNILNIANLLYFLLTLLLIAMSGREYPHYAMVLIPALAYPYSILGSYIEQKEEKSIQTIKFIFAAYILAIITLPTWISQTRIVLTKYESRNANELSETICSVQEIIEDNTTEQDKITVYGNWDVIYVATKRLSASRYSYQYPISNIDPNIMDEYFEELTDDLPAMIVIAEGFWDERMQEFVMGYNYNLIWSSKETYDGIMVYQRP